MNPLQVLAIASLITAAICCLLIVFDLLAENLQKMAVMNIVWPVTALYAGPLALWAYYKIGRQSTKKPAQDTKQMSHGMKKPFWQMVTVAATHCGSGCTLGDLAAEWFVVLVPISFLGQKMFGTWVLDFVLAFVFGIAFQYFSIKPMRNLSSKDALWAALKADTLSLTAWQIGMYGWMGIAIFYLFKREIPQTEPLFWFLMQIAMIFGFFTSYPVNWWLLKIGVKEKM